MRSSRAAAKAPSASGGVAGRIVLRAGRRHALEDNVGTDSGDTHRGFLRAPRSEFEARAMTRWLLIAGEHVAADSLDLRAQLAAGYGAKVRPSCHSRVLRFRRVW